MKPTTETLTITRQLKHERTRVFSALTDPQKMARWFFGMADGRAKVTNDLRPGGGYLIEMTDGTMRCTPQGKYVEIVPPERLVFTWILKGSENLETRVTITLAERDGGTSLTILHELPGDEVEGHRGGWNVCFDNLALYLAGRMEIGAAAPTPVAAEAMA